MSLEKTLNQFIADFSLTYFKLHRFHWFVEGAGFFSLHEKYEELYDETTALLDEYAERLLAIGGKPISTMKEFLAATTLSEEGSETKPDDIHKTIIADYQKMVDNLKKGISVAEEADDNTTADLFIETIGTFQKHIWMFKQTIK